MAFDKHSDIDIITFDFGDHRTIEVGKHHPVVLGKNFSNGSDKLFGGLYD